MVSLALPNIKRKVNTDSSQTCQKKKKKDLVGDMCTLYTGGVERVTGAQGKSVTGELGILALNRNLFSYNGFLDLLTCI